MNRLSKKFILGIVLILMVSAILSILFNEQFVGRYYLYQKRENLEQIGRDVLEKMIDGRPVDELIRETEEENKVILVYTENGGMDNDTLNNEIRNAFQEKGVGFQRFWLWEEDYKKVLSGSSQIRLYKQEKLSYSLLVDYVPYQAGLFSVAAILPDMEDAFSIVNMVSAFISLLTIGISIIFIIFLIKRIIYPLKQIEQFACSMGEHKFIPLDIHTHDELEQVGNTLNVMGTQIVDFQEKMEEKNAQMEQLLDNVAHDLKTPVSLIKLYGEGIRDGLDDGTFLDTMMMENAQMEEMINRLLFLSRIDKEGKAEEAYSASKRLEDILVQYAPLVTEQGLELHLHIEEAVSVWGRKEWLDSVFLNLISNSVKYASLPRIDICLEKSEDSAIFTISNASDNNGLDLNRIWEPYYVGEKSRNKRLSGTGLGLPIVKKIVDKLGGSISCVCEEGQITFRLELALWGGMEINRKRL